jgi:hypothetical protein
VGAVGPPTSIYGAVELLEWTVGPPKGAVELPEGTIGPPGSEYVAV